MRPVQIFFAKALTGNTAHAVGAMWSYSFSIDGRTRRHAIVTRLDVEATDTGTGRSSVNAGRFVRESTCYGTLLGTDQEAFHNPDAERE